LWQFAIGDERDMVANLLPVLTTTALLVAKFSAGVVDTGGKLLPVLLISVVNLVLRISPRIFSEIRNYPNVIFRGLGEEN
jgi:hypothetical protein